MQSATFDPDTEWRIACADTLAWRSWDGEIILYDEISDEIHQFDPATTCIFEKLTEKPASLHEIATVLADKLQVQADEELMSMASQIVRILYEKCLIVSTRPSLDAAGLH